ncbi:hypothetical protein [Paracoccus onubensis]|uniref:hypothetical protein n=1 Tax=Paracoccus onubensis TaxID=1675788 RepID=UPI0011C457A8|nr:hypothetical protein [Paracoccus onubensis]
MAFDLVQMLGKLMAVRSTRFITLLGLFDANVSLSDEVGVYLDSFSATDREKLRQEFETCLRSGILGMERFYSSTSCYAKDETTARRFFNDVYRYAFEGGEEPYVPDYSAS